MKIKFNSFFIFVFIFIFFGFKPAHAESLIVEPEQTPLFNISSDGYWFPGKSLTRKITIANNSTETKLVAISPLNVLNFNPDLASVLKIQISDNFGNNLYGKIPTRHLSDFYLEKEYPLTFLSPNYSAIYSFLIDFDLSAGNEWQDKKTGFNLSVGFSSETAPEIPTPTPTNTLGPGPTNTPGPADTPTPTPIPGTFIPVTHGTEVINVPVLGAEASIAPSSTKTFNEKVLGTQKKKGNIFDSHTSLWWLLILYLIQAIFQIIINKKASFGIKKGILFAQIILGILFAFIFWKLKKTAS